MVSMTLSAEDLLSGRVVLDPTHIGCGGASIGSLDVTIIGGSTSDRYDIIWSGTGAGSMSNKAGGTHVINNLTGGTYNVSLHGIFKFNMKLNVVTI